MRSTRRSLATIALIGLVATGCSSDPAETDPGASTGSSSAGTQSTVREQAMKFAACMRENGISAFPDPDASGQMTIDGILNGSSLDASTPAWKAAIRACRDLQPPGFTGHKRSDQQQAAALKFAQCMRDNGVKDFPDPTADGPVIDTNRIPSAAGRGARDIPGFQAAQDACRELGARAVEGQ